MDANLSHIVYRVSQLINDVDLENHDVDKIEDALKARRYEARYMQLTAVQTRASGGTITYVTFDAPSHLSWWDKNVSLLDSNYDALTPATSDYKRGRWTFSSEPDKPVWLLGFAYDVYGASADLLEERASQLSEDVQSFSAAHGTFAYANRRQGPLQLANEYRRKQWPTVSKMQRSDLA